MNRWRSGEEWGDVRWRAIAPAKAPGASSSRPRQLWFGGEVERRREIWFSCCDKGLLSFFLSLNESADPIKAHLDTVATKRRQEEKEGMLTNMAALEGLKAAQSIDDYCCRCCTPYNYNSIQERHSCCVFLLTLAFCEVGEKKNKLSWPCLHWPQLDGVFVLLHSITASLSVCVQDKKAALSLVVGFPLKGLTDLWSRPSGKSQLPLLQCVWVRACVQNHGRAPQTLQAQFVTADFLRASRVFIYLSVLFFFLQKGRNGKRYSARCFIAQHTRAISLKVNAIKDHPFEKDGGRKISWHKDIHASINVKVQLTSRDTCTCVCSPVVDELFLLEMNLIIQPSPPACVGYLCFDLLQLRAANKLVCDSGYDTHTNQLIAAPKKQLLHEVCNIYITKTYGSKLICIKTSKTNSLSIVTLQIRLTRLQQWAAGPQFCNKTRQKNVRTASSFGRGGQLF